MNIKKLSKQIYKANVKKGFWDKPRNEGEVLMLIITELSETLEADRRSSGTFKNLFHFENSIRGLTKKSEDQDHKMKLFEHLVKDTIGDELADVFIRLCDYCVGFKMGIRKKEIAKHSRVLINYRILENLGEELLIITHWITTLDRNPEMVNNIFSYIIWLANKLNIDLEKHIKYKMWYNSTRPQKHNKKY